MTMRVDAYTHFIPTRFYKDVMSSGNLKDIGKRMMGVPSIYDVNVRLKVVDKFKDYCADPVLPDAAVRDDDQERQGGRGVGQDRQRRLRRAVQEAPRPFPRLGGAVPDDRAGRRRSRSRARHEERRARRADLHQRRGPAARQSGVRAVLEGDEQDRHADLAASFPRRELCRLPERDQIEIRNLVDARLVVRDRRRDVAAGDLRIDGQYPN